MRGGTQWKWRVWRSKASFQLEIQLYSKDRLIRTPIIGIVRLIRTFSLNTLHWLLMLKCILYSDNRLIRKEIIFLSELSGLYSVVEAGFPKGRAPTPLEGCQGPTWLHRGKLVCKNERIWTLRGVACRRHPWIRQCYCITQACSQRGPGEEAATSLRPKRPQY